MSKIENFRNKPKKTAVELVQMLRDEKGIQFNIMSEEQAVEYFSRRNNYLRTASYRKNYPKHIAGPNEGKYINLEFAYLSESVQYSPLREHSRILQRESSPLIARYGFWKS